MRWILSTILALGLFLRVGWLNKVPPELFGDELDVGYQAYSIFKTGRDLYNQPLPTLVHSFPEWREPLLVYQTVPSIAILGLNEYGVRIPEVVMGALSPIIIFLLVYQFTRNKAKAGIAALVITFMPWHIIYSRMGGFGSVTLINIIMISLILFKKKKYISSIIFASLSIYTYNTALIFVPLIFLPLVIIDKYRPKMLHLVILAILISPFIYHLIRGAAGNRFSQISLANDTQILEDITNGRIDHPGIIGKILYNRPIQYLSIFTKNYFQSFSTEFLFIRGDPSYRHSLQIIGGLLPSTSIFLVLGLMIYLRKNDLFWPYWLVIAPIASALTLGGGYHATRNFLMVPPLAILISFGIAYLLKKNKLITLIIIVISLLQFSNFYFYYLTDYPQKSWRWWSVGFKQSFSQMNNISSNYSRIFINNTYEPSLIRFLFWTKYDPAKFHQEFTGDIIKSQIFPNYDGFSLGSKYFFGQFTDAAKKGGLNNSLIPGALYLISQRDDVAGDWDWRTSAPTNIDVVGTSTNPYNQPVLYLITKK